MKNIIKLISPTVISVLLFFSFLTEAFADRTLIIPDLPKQPYRHGVGAYEGVVAHS